LSTTIAPEAAILGERTLEEVAPAEHSAMSMPEKSAVAASSTMICPPSHSRWVPAERSEAKKADLVERKGALDEDPAHHRADLSRRSDHCDPHGRHATR